MIERPQNMGLRRAAPSLCRGGRDVHDIGLLRDSRPSDARRHRRRPLGALPAALTASAER